jgi:hypothetical protein
MTVTVWQAVDYEKALKERGWDDLFDRGSIAYRLGFELWAEKESIKWHVRAHVNDTCDCGMFLLEIVKDSEINDDGKEEQ